MATFYVNTDSTAGGDGTTNATSGANRAYATLAAALAARWTGTPSTPIEIECSAPSGVADAVSAAVTIANVTSTASNYLRIYPASGHRAGRLWDAAKYRLERSSTFGEVLTIDDEFVRVEGIQVRNTGALTNQCRAIRINAKASGDQRVVGCYAWCSGSQTSPDSSYAVWVVGNVAFKVTVANCILRGGKNGFEIGYTSASGAALIIYNNLAIDQPSGGVGIHTDLDGSTNLYLKNNAVQGTAATNYSLQSSGTKTTATNLSEDASSPQTGLRSLAITFADEGGGDFMLGSSDTAAKDAGTDLSADAQYAFAVDMEGTSRTGSWDIGPLEYVGGGGGGGSAGVVHYLNQRRIAA